VSRPTRNRRAVVVGASIAGVRAAEELRRQGFQGELVLVGAEPDYPPTDRPPLSKDLLAGAITVEQARLRVRRLDATVRTGMMATRLDLRARAVELHDESLVPFDDLVIATGTTPRVLPISASIAGVYVLRTADDCLAIRAAVARADRVVIVGAGFVGCEVASTCRELGVEVTVIEPLPTPLHRAFGPAAGALVAEMHRRRGVDLRLGVAITNVVEGVGADGTPTIRAVLLSDGTELPCEVLVVAIGVVPSTDWLESSGLVIDDGVVCDETCAALGATGVVAAGDVARWHHPLFRRSVRVEHWTNAIEQGRHAARRLLAGTGPGTPFAAVPYFWSNQYDHTIHFVGIPGPQERVESCGDRTRVVTYREADRLVGAFIVDGPSLVATYRKEIIAANTEPSLAAFDA
jgi:NADPH-dependent 2,4-dienoyl-CoA reductase/sulfur reductase-like enzyme